MIHASQVLVFIGLIAWGLVVGLPEASDAADMRPLGETATRLPRGRLATSVEGGHTCVVVADGTVRCWGLNASGQLGDGTINTPVSSVRVTGISTAIAVATGKDHSCALLVDATVRCWGANGVGQLGNGSFNPSLQPFTVSGITNAVSISGGSNHTCVRRSDGSIACWGSNEFGQIGDGSIANNRSTPVPVQGISNARMVAVGSTHTCAVRVDGTAACWGGNGVGQLGIGVSGDNRPLPNTVPGLAGVWLVATGHRFSCALLGIAEIRCWGLNDSAQLGNASGQNSPTPITVETLGSRGVALGNGHACRLVGGSAQCWGQNAVGQLGRGFAGAPLPAPGSVSGVSQMVELVAGLDRTCALDAGDLVLCWGENSARQLANGSTADVLVPTAVGGTGGAVSARGVAAGFLQTCAWRADGTIACWGFPRTLGNGSTSGSLEPVAVSAALDGNPSNNTLSVVAGDEHTCAQRASGSILCWGNNIEDQVNPNLSDDVALIPVGGVGVVSVSIAAGRAHTITASVNDEPDATTFGWGANDMFQLGTIAASSVSVRFRAGPLPEPVSVAAGGEHTCALQARGTVMCWGSNEFGQLGNNSGSTGANGVPQPVQGIVDAVAIAAGTVHTCALLVGGTVRCWGGNNSRQLGDGTTQERRSPVLVPGIGVGEAVGIVAGGGYTCILGVRGDVRCWGGNSQGELGDNTFVDRPAPVTVQRATRIIETSFEGRVVTATAPLNQVVALVGGGTHVCAVRVNGQPVCWGNNTFGRLGDGTTTDRPHAMGVASFLANIDPAAELHRNGRKAELTALVNCPEGARFRVRLDLQQDHAEAHGQEEGKCEGGLARVPVNVSVQGRARLDEGPADARAVIDVRLKGEVIDHQEWGRVVNLGTTP